MYRNEQDKSALPPLCGGAGNEFLLCFPLRVYELYGRRLYVHDDARDQRSVVFHPSIHPSHRDKQQQQARSTYSEALMLNMPALPPPKLAPFSLPQTTTKKKKKKMWDYPVSATDSVSHARGDQHGDRPVCTSPCP